MVKICNSNCLYLGSLITLGLAFVLLLYFAYALFFPIKVIEIKSLKPVSYSNDRGKPLLMEIEYCKYTNTTAKVQPQLTNGIKYWLEAYESNNLSGCNKMVFGKIIVPEEIPEGVYRLRMNFEFRVNPLRFINYSFTSEPFYIHE